MAAVIERPRRYSYSEPRRHGEERTILERQSIYYGLYVRLTIADAFPEAWHIVNTTDPLAASDDEDIDDNVRLDYSKVFSCDFIGILY